MRYLIAIIVLVLSAFILNEGIKKSEVAECLTWQTQAKEYNSFYLTQWQAKQCQAHNIHVVAPIKP